MARTDVDTTVRRVTRQLEAAHRNEINQLQNAVDASTSTVTLKHNLDATIRDGSVICIDFELMRVVSFVEGSRVLTVIRGWLDSDATTHDADAIVDVDPVFSNWDVLDAMRTELAGWGPTLYRTLTWETSVSYATSFLAAPDSWIDAYGIIGAWVKPSASLNPIDGVSYDSWPSIPVQLERGGPAWTAAPTSGAILTMHHWSGMMGDSTIVVRAAVPFDPTLVVSGADFLTDVGIDEGLIEILELGAKVKLTADDMERRNRRQTQDDPRRTEENPPGSALPVSNALYARYRYRKQEEVAKFQARNPVRFAS